MPTPWQSAGNGQPRHPLFRQHPSAMLAPIEILSRHLLCPPVPTRITVRKFLKTTAGFQAFKTLSTRVASSDFKQSQYFSFLRQESRLPRIEMQSVHPEIHRWWPESMQVIHAEGVPPKRLSRWRSAWLLLNQPVWSPGVLCVRSPGTAETSRFVPEYSEKLCGCHYLWRHSITSAR